MLAAIRGGIKTRQLFVSCPVKTMFSYSSQIREENLILSFSEDTRKKGNSSKLRLFLVLKSFSSRCFF
jgi:hypothetical protein